MGCVTEQQVANLLCCHSRAWWYDKIMPPLGVIGFIALMSQRAWAALGKAAERDDDLGAEGLQTGMSGSMNNICEIKLLKDFLDVLDFQTTSCGHKIFMVIYLVLFTFQFHFSASSKRFTITNCMR